MHHYTVDKNKELY